MNDTVFTKEEITVIMRAFIEAALDDDAYNVGEWLRIVTDCPKNVSDRVMLKLGFDLDDL